MTAKSKIQQKFTLASTDLLDAYTDFMLSRQAMNCTPATLTFYQYTAGVFLVWCEEQSIATPEEVTARYIRQYLAMLADRGKKDTTIHAHARAIRTLLRFWYGENYIHTPVKFEMPKLAKKRLPVLTEDQLQTLLKHCNVRDRAILLFLVDSGLRRAEVCALDWSDVDMQSGLVRVRHGKGRKDRSAVVGAKTRRALLAYRRTLANRDGALFQTQAGTRMRGNTLRSVIRRLAKQTGIEVTAHALRRTFVIMSLRNGMDVLHLQAMLGHANLDMVYHYAQMVDDDLLQAHRKYSPIDNLNN
jgi:integrase/recombinase XerD